MAETPNSTLGSKRPHEDDDTTIKRRKPGRPRKSTTKVSESTPNGRRLTNAIVTKDRTVPASHVPVPGTTVTHGRQESLGDEDEDTIVVASGQSAQEGISTIASEFESRHRASLLPTPECEREDESSLIRQSRSADVPPPTVNSRPEEEVEKEADPPRPREALLQPSSDRDAAQISLNQTTTARSINLGTSRINESPTRELETSETEMLQAEPSAGSDDDGYGGHLKRQEEFVRQAANIRDQIKDLERSKTEMTKGIPAIAESVRFFEKQIGQIQRQLETVRRQKETHEDKLKALNAAIEDTDVKLKSALTKKEHFQQDLARVFSLGGL